MSAFQEMLSSLISRGARLVDFSQFPTPANDGLEPMCKALMSTRGEASGVAMATEILSRFRGLDDEARERFFLVLARDFDPDPATAQAAADAYAQEQSPENLAALIAAAEPPRQELLRRLNAAPGGTAALVDMRTTLFRLLDKHPDLKRVDVDFAHLFSSWFNRGFLVLKPIDWASPAYILEKIIAYEAVHEIGDWEELRRRLQPPDRRCFAFFHPSMPDEPLIFVEVALTREVPGSVQDLLSEGRNPLDAETATTAVFYSISNCQEGLRGVSFGSFLIKQVAEDLMHNLPGLKTFVTLSPVPGLMNWLRRQAAAEPDGAAAEIVELADREEWHEDPAANARLRELLMPMTARYLVTEKRADGTPVDAVARFHLGNGAVLRQINWLGDLSPRGLARSAGIMVNYEYVLPDIEANHEAYAERREVKVSRSVRSLLPSQARAARRKSA